MVVYEVREAGPRYGLLETVRQYFSERLLASGEGEATRRLLYNTAIALIEERGYEATPLRDVAARAGVSVGLLYRYFPSKRAIVLELYDRLSEDYAREADLPSGRWRDRTMAAPETSLRVLRPHRITLRALAPLMVGDAEEGVFARSTAFSRWSSGTEASSPGAVVTVRGARLSQPDTVDRGTPRSVAMLGSRVSWTRRTRRWP